MSRPRKPTGASHPVISALISSLPAPGSVWPIKDRMLWMSALQAGMNLIYLQHDGGPIPGAEPDEASNENILDRLNSV